MTPKREKRIISRVNVGDFPGRIAEAERLYLHAVSGGGSSRVRVTGAPGAGTSELLRHTFDRLFLGQRFVIPFYFALRADDRTARDAAARLVYEFLLQAVAFRMDDPQMIAASPDVCELQKTSPLPDAEWIKSLCEVCEAKGSLNDEKAFIRSALAAPVRAASEGQFRVCLFIDDLHEGAALEGGQLFLEHAARIMPPAGSIVFLGSRRKLRLAGGPFEIVPIELLDRESGAAAAASIASEFEVDIEPSVADLLAVQSGGSPRMIRSIISGAREENISLQSYRDASRAYVAQLIDGDIGEYFTDLFARAMPDQNKQVQLVAALSSASAEPNATFAVSALGERLGLNDFELARLVEQLSIGEVIDVSGGPASISSNNIIRDHLAVRRRIASGEATAASAGASAAIRFLQRAPLSMAREYRRTAAVGLQELLSQFDLHEVPRAAIDYRFFRDRYKGLSDNEIRSALNDDEDRFTLPQIVRAEPLSSFAPAFAAESEPERAVAGVGFTGRAYLADDQIVWIAAELDSKLEADVDLARDWCERLDNAATFANFDSYRIWLVAPEGFSPGAIEILAERGGIGSSRRQLEFLREMVQSGEATPADVQEFEMVIPVGGETELISAHALEEIARRHDYPVKAINQIKTALVEACINAAEHGLSPDGKIYQKFTLHRDRLVITVSNRGLRLSDKIRRVAEQDAPPAETRRGWGLNLIRSLMDDVRVEAVDDGTRIVMTKVLTVA